MDLTDLNYSYSRGFLWGIDPAKYRATCYANWHSGMQTAFLALLFPQFLSCCFSLCLIPYFSSNFFRKGNYHANAKMIVSLQLLFVIVFCAEYITAVMKHLQHVFLSPNDPCSFVEFAGDCTVFYYSHFTSLAGMSMTQMFLSAERAISSRYSKTYESFGVTLGVVFCILALGCSGLVAWFSLHGFNPAEMRGNCMGSPYSGQSHFLYITLITCDFISMTLFLLSWCCSKKKNETGGKYFLGSQYQNRETRNLIVMFAPVNFVHFIVYLLYALGTAIARQYVAEMDHDFIPIYANLIMLVPYYTTFELIFLICALKRNTGSQDRFTTKLNSQTLAANTDHHFETLSKQWN